MAKKIKIYLKFVSDILEIVLILFALSWFIRTYFFQPYEITDNTMSPTIQTGDKVCIKTFNKESSFTRGSILIVSNNKQLTAKRVIGLPGDAIEIKNQYIYVNNQLIYEKYVVESMKDTFGPITVPENQIFLLNDDRKDRADSRTLGCFSVKSIYGRVVVEYYPIKEFQVFFGFLDI
ncbi:MAG: signal peptidase I [Eubacteriales bacterium]